MKGKKKLFIILHVLNIHILKTELVPLINLLYKLNDPTFLG